MSYHSRIVSLLLVAALLCGTFTVPSSKAETPEISVDEAHTVYENMLDQINQNPAEGLWLEDPLMLDLYCIRLYNYIDPEIAKSVFYGSAEDAASLLKRLCVIISEEEICSDAGLQLAEVFYVSVWLLINYHVSSRLAIKETMKGIFADHSEAVISDAVDACIDYMEEKSPKIKNRYVMITNEVTIHGSNEYVQNYNKGVKLFDQGRHEEAIEAYTEALKYKPNDTVASLEIAEAYIATGNFAEAKVWLRKIAPYLEKNGEKAYWLRRCGFIAIEEMHYQTAYAYYVYSLTFENSPRVGQELEYIRNIAPETEEFTSEEALDYLKKQEVLLFE